MDPEILQCELSWEWEMLNGFQNISMGPLEMKLILIASVLHTTGSKYPCWTLK